MEASVEIILKILREERNHTNCLMIGGFSQGAVMSLYTGLYKYEGILQSIIALSGFAVPMKIDQKKLSIPVLVYHGAKDDRIPLHIAEDSIKKYLHNTNLTFQINQTMAHEVYDEEYEYIRKWLSNNII